MGHEETGSRPYPTWFGLREGAKGTQTSRTIMLAELAILFRAVPAEADRESYRTAVIADNVLGKKTTSNRKITFQRLSELYALDPKIALFRIFRHVMGFDGQSNPGDSGFPLLGFLVAFARDPLLRLTAPAVLEAPEGQIVTTAYLDAAVERQAPGRLSAAIRNKVARNAGSSWTQSGHLAGRARKVRRRPLVTPSTTALALLLGRVTGTSGAALFHTEWTRVLDQPEATLHETATQASHLGLIELRQSGPMVDVRLPALLTREEEELLHGTS